MTNYKNLPDSDDHLFPLEPRYTPANRLARQIYDFLASARLAMALLVAILIGCVVGVTVFRGETAGKLIFSTLWFNGLLVLLIVNVVCCFFGRIWHRKLTVITFGMILFHLSFVTMFCGIIFNSLFYFRGSLRLTEGETLPNGMRQSYDVIDQGRFFDLSSLKGNSKLVKMHTGYKVDGSDKRAAYEILIGDRTANKQGIIYITHNLDYQGFKYLPEKEGFSLLVVLSDRYGKEIHGSYMPLQSIKQKNGDYYYTTGTVFGPGNIPFPQDQQKPLIGLQVSYSPSKLSQLNGDALFQVWALNNDGSPADKPYAAGSAVVGKDFNAGEYTLSVKEVRYWAAMNVRYEPGKPLILSSLWVGFAGLILTNIGRIMKSRKRQEKVA